MPNGIFEYQENIRKLAVKIVKHYRGKGPENVKVKAEDGRIEIEIKGILSNLSEILVKEGAVEVVKDYWKILKPYLEKEFLKEAEETVGSRFTYSWKICDLESGDRTVIIEVNKMV